MTSAKPTDVAEVLVVHFPGIVVQRNLADVIAAWLAEYGAVSADDVPAILAIANSLLVDDVAPPYLPIAQEPYPLALPPYPAGLPRFPDSNPAPDGWSILDAEKEALGGKL